MPVDSSGGPTVDPTRNVLDLVRAAVTRLDDLRELESRRLEEKLEGEKVHIREILKLTSDYEDKLAVAEASRINAIRAVDINAVAVASERATQQASVLATQVTASAETLRTLVATSAGALAEQLTQIIKPINDRIASLERTQYEGVGKAGVTDPQLIQLVAEMRATRDALSVGAGAKQGAVETRTTQQMSAGMILGVFGAVMTVIGLAASILIVVLTR